MLALLLAFHQVAMAGQPCPNRALGDGGTSSLHHQHHGLVEDGGGAAEPHDAAHDSSAEFDAHCAQVDESIAGSPNDPATSGAVLQSVVVHWQVLGGDPLRHHAQKPSYPSLPPPVPIAIFLHRLRD